MSRKLASKNKKKNDNPGVEITLSILEYSLALLIGIICVFVPLYMEDGYYKIGNAKFDAYSHILEVGLPIIFVFLILYKVFDWKANGFKNQAKTMLKKLEITDWFFLSFFTVVLISYFACGDLEFGFWGYDGWFMGVFFQGTILLLYFLLSRHGNYAKVLFTLLCLIASITYIFGILHRLLIDVLGTYDGIDDYYKTLFLSTLGQASWYSSFVCTVLPLGVCCYFISQNLKVRIASAIFTLIGFMTLVTQNSDSAYIAFVLMMLVLFYFAVENEKKMMRLLEIAALFLVAPKIMQLLLYVHPNETLDLDQLSMLLVFSALPWPLLILVALLWGGCYLTMQKQLYPVKAMKIIRNVVYILFVVGILFAMIILKMSASHTLSGGLLAISERVPYLTWDDTWGNGRGFTWEATAKMIREFSMKNKLIGVGPDCYQSYAYTYYEEYIRSKWGENILTNAHNEWMNMIVNFGFLGAISYMGIFISAFVSFMKNAKKEPMLILCAGSIAAYMGHNLFCYQQVLCTPFVIIIMGYGMYMLRSKKYTMS